MIITREKVASNYDYNYAYNQAVGTLVGEIFQTESEGPISYLPIPRFQSTSPWMSATASKIKIVKNKYSAGTEEIRRFDLTGLDQYETTLFSCLAWGEYSTYVVAGEMGSGKSTCANFLMRALARPKAKDCGKCQNCSPVLITIDFNKGYDIHDAELVQKTFREELYSELKPRLRSIFAAEKLTSRFVEFCRGEGASHGFNRFDDFVQSVRKANDWSSLTYADQAERLIDFVNDDKRDIHQQLRMSMLLLNYVRRTCRQDSPCLVLLFDNLDRILPDAQLDLLVTILSLQSIAKSKALVTLRKTTFERLNSQAAYSFGYVNHSGPRPLEIVKCRLQYWVKNWEALPQVMAIPDDFRTALYARLQYVFELVR